MSIWRSIKRLVKKVVPYERKSKVIEGVLEISNQGHTEVKIPGDFKNFSYTVVSGPGIPLPSSNTQDAEYINITIERRNRKRFPFKGAWVAVITWMVLEPRVIEYAIN